MAKRFKLRISLPSFQFCRSKQPSSFPKSPSPAAYLFSPVNPKSFEISYPDFPDPPPSTPNHPSFKSHVSSKINSPFSYDFFDRKKANNLAKAEKNKKEKKKAMKSKQSVSSADSDWFDENNEETDSRFSSSRSFDSSYDFGYRSLDSSHEFGYPLETITESPTQGGRKKKKKNLKVRRLKRYVSNSWKGVEKAMRTGLMTPESESPVRPSPAEGKVSESFAVVKSSKDPYEDFKRSMLEMILEKQMFEAKDLEQLLQCFLSLNSRLHHAVIVQAFSEIWEDLFL